MVIVRDRVTLAELETMAQTMFGDFVKAVVDIERGIAALGGGLHSDEERILLEDGSAQEHLWGVNLYPSVPSGEWIEFDSMINVRPWQGNRSRGVDDAATRAAIASVLNRLVQR